MSRVIDIEGIGEVHARELHEDVLPATSGKGYKTKADCLKVIDTIKSAAGRAKIEEVTSAK